MGWLFTSERVAKEQGFTHLARMFGYKCYFDTRTSTIKGTNILNDVLIDLCIKWYNLNNPFDFFEDYYWRIQLIKRL